MKYIFALFVVATMVVVFYFRRQVSDSNLQPVVSGTTSIQQKIKFPKECYSEVAEVYGAFSVILERDTAKLGIVIEDKYAEREIRKRLAPYSLQSNSFIAPNSKGHFGYKENGDLRMFSTAFTNGISLKIDTGWVVIREQNGCFKIASVNF